MFYGEAKVRGIPSATGLAFSENLFDWKKAAFPLIRGHDAEVIEAAPGLRVYSAEVVTDGVHVAGIAPDSISW